MKEFAKNALKLVGLYRPVRTSARRFGIIGGHGHELLLDQLEKDRRQYGTRMAGRWLVEIGSTREELPGQGSTASLAAFCSGLEMKFTTVDMDPENTERANETVGKYGSGLEAVNGKGEAFLERAPDPIHYCYLDAFDVDHGGHSDKRKKSYQEYLGVDISNDLCYEMHLDCAKALQKNMAPGGTVVFDDCWRNASGWQGKGKTAVPYLITNGFIVVGVEKNAVALRRTE